MVWDTRVPGLTVVAYPTGRKIFKCIYHFSGRTSWFTIGQHGSIDLDDARNLAATVLLKVATDTDPQAEKVSQRSSGTFDELAKQYAEYASTTK